MSTAPVPQSLNGSKQVHVLFMIDQLCELGGAERVMLQTIGLLPKDRFRCSLITFKINTDREFDRILPCPHYVFPLKRTYDWKALQTARSIRKFIREESVDIVHTFHETSDLWGGFISRMKGGPALVSSRRDMGILRLPKHNLGYRMMNSRFDLVLTVSDEVRRFTIRKDSIPAAKVLTLYNGLDTNRIQKLNVDRSFREVLGLNAEAPVILTVGHVRRIKGIDVLLETAAIVAREFPEVVFAILGRNSDPEHFRMLEDRIVQLGIQKNVKFLGESNDVLAVLHVADVFFLPSRSEGFSNALIEAMACGLPCVATRVGGNPEAVEEGRSGYLVESEDVTSASDRILRLLRNPVRAQELGVAGRRIVDEKFTAEVMIRRLVQHYDRLLAERNR
jgi:glycosyltransferase involved in cell wall biosynthesis